MTVNCPLCGSDVDEENGPVRLTDEGYPVSCAVVRGLPVPFISVPPEIVVSLNGERVGGCVGYDSEKGDVWRYVEVDGIPLCRDDGFVIEHVVGTVALSKLPPDGAA